MVNITIRNIPDEILKRIRIFAAKERRSLNSEMLIVIEKGLSAAILEKTGANIENVAGVISPAGRERIWNDLCGSWQDSRTFTEINGTVYKTRDNTVREDEAK